MLDSATNRHVPYTVVFYGPVSYTVPLIIQTPVYLKLMNSLNGQTTPIEEHIVSVKRTFHTYGPVLVPWSPYK